MKLPVLKGMACGAHAGQGVGELKDSSDTKCIKTHRGGRSIEGGSCRACLSSNSGMTQILANKTWRNA